MARKARALRLAEESIGGVAFAAASLGYAPVKSTAGKVAQAILLRAPVHEEEKAEVGMHAVARALAGLAAMDAEVTPETVCMVDAAPLVPKEDMAAEIEAEAAATVLGKRLGKPVARGMEKLAPNGAAMVTVGSACSLLLKLMRGDIDRLRETAASRLILLHPSMSKVCQRLMLSPDWRAAYGRSAPRNLPLDVVYSDEAHRAQLEPILRDAYPIGRSAVCPDTDAAVLLARAFAAAVSDAPDALDGAHVPATPTWEPDSYDDMGRCLWLASLSIEMDAATKQYVPLAEDITAEIAGLAPPPPPPPTTTTTSLAEPVVASDPPNSTPVAVTSPALDDAAAAALRATLNPTSPSAAHCVGALLLRGNRCVLVRSLSKPKLWSGMAVPAIPLEPGMDPVERARASVSVLCDIDSESEIVKLAPEMPPVALYHSPSCRTDVYFFYAARPPPPGPLEDADLEDDEDLYDWYTFPNAITAIQRGKAAYASAAVAALEAAAMALRNAARAGVIQAKFGGVFGQELTTTAEAKAKRKEPAPAPALAPAVTPGAWSPFAAAAAAANGYHAPSATSPAVAAAAATVGEKKGQRAVPVTLLSGFLGAGKTTLLKRILEQTHAQETVRVAVLVNDMAAVNIDAGLVRNTKMLQREEKLVELHNGCICCTLREDLVKALADLAAEGKFDAIVVESTGVSDPVEVAETFTMEVESDSAVEVASIVDALRGKSSLNELAKLDTCVTLVDVAGFDTDLATAAELQERFEGSADEGDDRSVAPLLMSQIEFADVIVLTKCDLVADEEAAAVESAVRALNAGAKIVRARHGDVALSEVLRTGLFDYAKVTRGAGWLHAMLSGEDHVPETEEYGISSFVYKARAPFHPVRLWSFLDNHFVVRHAVAMLPEPEVRELKEKEEGEGEEDIGAAADVRAVAEAQATREREGNAKAKVARMRQAFGNILRSKGFVWLAGRDSQIGEWSQAGAVGEFGCGGSWMSCQPIESWPEKGSEEYDLIMKDYDGPVLEDRRQEIVFIGQNLEQGAITKALDACLVNAEEAGANIAEAAGDAWKLGLDLKLDGDPFPPWPEHDHDHDHDHSH